MPIAASDIYCRLSGGASNANANAALGGAKSTTNAPTRLFDDVTSTEASAGTIEYRCVYVHNGHASLTLQGAKAWAPSNTPSTSTIVEIGVGTSATNGTEQSVANERTAPTGVTFAPAATFAAAVDLGDIPPGQHRAIWLRRTVTAGAVALASDPVTIRATGDTTP
jgi:hypothetical protein